MNKTSCAFWHKIDRQFQKTSGAAKQSEAKNTDPGFVGESRVPAEESPEDA